MDTYEISFYKFLRTSCTTLAMLRVYMVSGDELAAIPVTAVSDVRDLKQQLLCSHCGALCKGVLGVGG